jgi:hypothetical protein
MISPINYDLSMLSLFSLCGIMISSMILVFQCISYAASLTLHCNTVYKKCRTFCPVKFQIYRSLWKFTGDPRQSGTFRELCIFIFYRPRQFFKSSGQKLMALKLPHQKRIWRKLQRICKYMFSTLIEKLFSGAKNNPFCLLCRNTVQSTNMNIDAVCQHGTHNFTLFHQSHF